MRWGGVLLNRPTYQLNGVYVVSALPECEWIDRVVGGIGGV
jgi:hypothetical protein